MKDKVLFGVINYDGRCLLQERDRLKDPERCFKKQSKVNYYMSKMFPTTNEPRKFNLFEIIL